MSTILSSSYSPPPPASASPDSAEAPSAPSPGDDRLPLCLLSMCLNAHLNGVIALTRENTASSSSRGDVEEEGETSPKSSVQDTPEFCVHLVPFANRAFHDGVDEPDSAPVPSPSDAKSSESSTGLAWLFSSDDVRSFTVPFPGEEFEGECSPGSASPVVSSLHEDAPRSWVPETCFAVPGRPDFVAVVHSCRDDASGTLCSGGAGAGGGAVTEVVQLPPEPEAEASSSSSLSLIAIYECSESTMLSVSSPSSSSSQLQLQLQLRLRLSFEVPESRILRVDFGADVCVVSCPSIVRIFRLLVGCISRSSSLVTAPRPFAVLSMVSRRDNIVVKDKDKNKNKNKDRDRDIVASVGVSRKGSVVAVGPSEESRSAGAVRVVDCRGEVPQITTIAAHSSKVRHIAVNSAGTLIATTSDRGTLVKLWSVKLKDGDAPAVDSLKELRRGSFSNLIRSVSFANCHDDAKVQYVVASSKSGSVHVWPCGEGHQASSGGLLSWIPYFRPERSAVVLKCQPEMMEQSCDCQALVFPKSQSKKGYDLCVFVSSPAKGAVCMLQPQEGKAKGKGKARAKKKDREVKPSNVLATVLVHRARRAAEQGRQGDAAVELKSAVDRLQGESVLMSSAAHLDKVLASSRTFSLPEAAQMVASLYGKERQWNKCHEIALHAMKVDRDSLELSVLVAESEEAMGNLEAAAGRYRAAQRLLRRKKRESRQSRRHSAGDLPSVAVGSLRRLKQFEWKIKESSHRVRVRQEKVLSRKFRESVLEREEDSGDLDFFEVEESEQLERPKPKRKSLSSSEEGEGEIFHVVPEVDEMEEEEEEEEGEEVIPELSKAEQRYRQVLAEAKSVPMRDLQKLRVLSLIGRDDTGSPVILFKELHFSSDQISRLFHYIVSELHPIASKTPYVLIWALNHAKKRAHVRRKTVKPGLSFLLRSYRSLSQTIIANTKAVFLIHPTFYIKLAIKFLRGVMSQTTLKRIHFVKNFFACREMAPFLRDPHMLPLPASLLLQNVKKNRVALYDGGVFGLPVAEVMLRPENAGLPTPAFLAACFDVIEANCEFEGLYRKVGSAAEVEDLRKLVDNGFKIDYEHSNLANVSSMVKLWFRMLPDGLFTSDLFDALLRASASADDRIAVRAVVSRLPRSNWEVAKAFCFHLRKISKFSEKNMMTTRNLAICLSPSLIRKVGMSAMQALPLQSQCCRALEIMIQEPDVVFKKE